MTSWYDDFGAGTYATTTSTNSNGVNIFYDKKFLQTVKNTLRLIPFGQRRPLPMGEGKTIEFFRWLNIAPSVSGATLTESINPNATTLSDQKLQAVLGEYGAFSQVSSLIKQTHIDRDVTGIVELYGEHAGTILDLLTKFQVVSNGSYPLAADLATTSTFAGVLDSGATSTTAVDAALNSNTNYGDANDDLNQSVIIITSGAAYGQARAITDFVTSGGTMTVSPAWDVTPVAGDTYVVTTPDELTVGDKLSYANVKKARTLLAKYKARKFEGGYYVGLASPDMLSGLMDDTDWKAVKEYSDPSGLYDAEAGRFAGVRMIEETNPFQFPIVTRGTAGTGGGIGANGGNYSATGAIGSALVLGREAFGVTTFKNKMGQLGKPPIIIKNPGASDTSNPLNRYSTIGWAMEFVAKALNPLFAVQIWNYTG